MRLCNTYFLHFLFCRIWTVLFVLSFSIPLISALHLLFLCWIFLLVMFKLLKSSFRNFNHGFCANRFIHECHANLWLLQQNGIFIRFFCPISKCNFFLLFLCKSEIFMFSMEKCCLFYWNINPKVISFNFELEIEWNKKTFNNKTLDIHS